MASMELRDDRRGEILWLSQRAFRRLSASTAGKGAMTPPPADVFSGHMYVKLPR